MPQKLTFLCATHGFVKSEHMVAWDLQGTGVASPVLTTNAPSDQVWRENQIDRGIRKARQEETTLQGGALEVCRNQGISSFS